MSPKSPINKTSGSGEPSPSPAPSKNEIKYYGIFHAGKCTIKIYISSLTMVEIFSSFGGAKGESKN